MKRWIAVLLSALLLFSVSGAALAAGPEALPEASDTIRISSAEELAELSALCTSDVWSENKTIVLTRDISLTGCDFSPIPLLAGTFDGCGYSILGISLDGDASTQGLFRMVLETGVVKNLMVSGTLHASGNGENIGGIAGVNYGTIENCRFDGEIRAQTAAGGIVGFNAEGALVSECKTSGSVAAYHRTGGIAGENRGVLSGCENRMSVNTEYIAAEQPDQKNSFDLSSLTLQEETLIDITDLGGIAGLNTSVIQNCDNYGDVGYPHTGYNVGGVAGRQSGRIIGCTNAGEITARKDAGGIAGQIEPHTVWNVTGTGIGEVQSQLYRLESLMRTMLGDLGDSQAGAQALLQEILQHLGNCSDIIGDMYPDVPWPTPGEGTDDGSGEGAGEGTDDGSGTSGGWIDPGSGSMKDLSDNLQQLVTLFGQMTDVVVSDTVIGDMQNVISQLMNVSTAFMNMVYSLGSSSVEMEDVSDAEDDSEALCLVAQSVNTAPVSADTNVGGIAGTVSLDISFDREDQLNLSSAMIGSGKYEIFARISGCENRSAVSAFKSCAGGIAGRMEYGLVISCDAVGEVSAEEGYAGGIVGYSSSSIGSCRARVNLSGKRHLGGIAGLGKDIDSCLAMPHFENITEFCGSVAGYADGNITDNIYSDSQIGGVDGFSFDGQTNYMAYDDFAALSDTPDFFRSIGVTFVKDGKTVETIEVPFGGTIDSAPTVPDEDGMYWQWIDFDPDDAVYYSRTIEGEFIRPVTTISTGEEEPLFLAEGVFRDGQTLLAAPFTPDGELLGIDPETVLAAYTVRVSDYSEPLTVRMLTAYTGSLYTLSDNALSPLSYDRDGSYIVFRVDNGASIVYLSNESSRSGRLIGGIAGGAAALAAVAFLIIRKKRKKSLTAS